jgi:hypothetical protein
LSFRDPRSSRIFMGAAQQQRSASQRALREASQLESLWHYPLQFV